jgi:hypothetical protein
MVPWAHQVRSAWLAGEAPLWNFASGGGYPLLANGQSSAFAPFRLIALPLGLGNSLTCEAALKILFALSFAYLYARRRRYSEAAAMITAISFAFSSFIAVWLYFPHSSVVAMLPALFYGLDLVLEQPSRRRTVFLALLLAAMVLSGHPESVGHCVLGGGLYTLFELWSLHRRRLPEKRPLLRRLGYLGAAGAAALLLSAPFIFPFSEAMPRSQRYQWLQGEGHGLSRSNIRSLVPMVQPEFYGLSKNENLWGPGIAEEVCGFAGVLGWIGWFALLARLIIRRRLEWFEWFLLTAFPFFIGAAFGWHGPGDLFEHLPLFSLAANQRLRLVVCWLVALLAGLFIDTMRKERRAAVIGLVTFILLFTLPFVIQKSYDWNHVREAWFTSIPRWGVIVAALGAVSFLPQRIARTLLLITVTLDLWAFAKPWNPIVPAEQLYAPTPLIAILRSEIDSHGQRGLVRIAGTSGTFFPNAAAMYGFEDIRAHDPMANGRYLGALRVFAKYTSDKYFGMLNDVDSPYVDFLNVRYVVTSPLEYYPSPWRMIYSGHDGRIFENPRSIPRFFVPERAVVEFDVHNRIAMMIRDQNFSSVAYLERLPTFLSRPVQQQLMRAFPEKAPRATITALRRTRNGYSMTIDARRWSFIASSSPNFPGWKVFRNGSERMKVIEMDDNFIGFAVPPGRSNITVVYEPLSFVVGIWIALITALALLVAFFFPRRSTRAEPVQAIMA